MNVPQFPADDRSSVTIARFTPAHLRRTAFVSSLRSWVSALLASPHFWPIVIVLGVVVIGNLPYLLHLFDPNPMDVLSGMGTVTSPGLFAGSSAVDPNVGFTAQTLGHLSMVDWTHGHVPWWDPYEGLGSPLAGEMQAAAFFPPTAFLLLSDGQVFSHMTVEIVAGLSTYFLLRRLSLVRPAAVAGAVAFALNGTYSWVSHAPANPVAFLPLLLLGVEFAADTERGGATRAWGTIAGALALSLYAGFPETAYIDGVFVAIWVVIRSVQLGVRWRVFLMTIVKGLGVGLLLAAPILVAFVDYLPHAYIGAHNGSFASASLPRGAFSQAFLPYVYGPIDGFSANDQTGTLTVIWGSVGGFATFSILVLALIGGYGSRLRSLRVMLMVWTIVCLGRTYGVEPFQHIVNALPGMGDVAFYRYSDASWELALILLAAFGLDEVARGKIPRWWILVCSIVSFGFLGLIASGSRGELHRLIGAAHHHSWAASSVLWAFLLAVLIGLVAAFARGRARSLILLAVVAIDSLVMFGIPELSAPRAVALDTAPVSFLEKNLGNFRFYSIGPIQPNYGSYFGISSLDVNDLPVPKTWNTFVTQELDRNAIPYVFNGPSRVDSAGPTALEEFARHVNAFELTGVKYLAVPTGTVPPVLAGNQRLKRTFSDATVQIYQLPSPSPMYSIRNGSCSIKTEDADAATVTCSSPQTLVRHELYMAGWSASINGRGVDVNPYDRVFQQVRVPVGTSVVRFRFAPPHVDAGYFAFLCGLACLVVPWLWRRARSSRSPGRTTRTASRGASP